MRATMPDRIVGSGDQVNSTICSDSNPGRLEVRFCCQPAVARSAGDQIDPLCIHAGERQRKDKGNGENRYPSKQGSPAESMRKNHSHSGVKR